MPAIKDLTRNVFSELDKSILDNFTSEEIQKIDDLAAQLNQILTRAKRRAKEVADKKAR
jgi:DNA-binding MarR family transcriptional regulator